MTTKLFVFQNWHRNYGCARAHLSFRLQYP